MMTDILTEKHTTDYICNYEFSALNDFRADTEALAEKLKDKKGICRLVFFGKTDDRRYGTELTILNERMRELFGNEYPLISYVTQPVLGDGSLAVEIHYLPQSLQGGTMSYRNENGFRYLILKTDREYTMMTEGIRGEESDETVAQQSDSIFRKLETVLSREGFGISDIVRQWNYINRITGFEGTIQNYQAFNDARTLFYEKTGWENRGYPAATGIGMDCGGVVVEVIATRPIAEQMKINAIDNPLQIAAHHYSQQVLLGEGDKRLKKRSTPKFERAKTVWSDTGYVCYISGTAAIRGEESLEATDAAAQTRMTLENIRHLISVTNQFKYGAAVKRESDADVIRVYVKNESDYEVIRENIEKNQATGNAIYTIADVCRDELLVEIEGIASMRYPGGE